MSTFIVLCSILAKIPLGGGGFEFRILRKIRTGKIRIVLEFLSNYSTSYFFPSNIRNLDPCKVFFSSANVVELLFVGFANVVFFISMIQSLQHWIVGLSIHTTQVQYSKALHRAGNTVLPWLAIWVCLVYSAHLSNGEVHMHNIRESSPYILSFHLY